MPRPANREVSQPVAVPARPAYLIESAENALRILLKVGHAPELRVTEISEELGIARSTAHRLLSTLVFYNFLRRDPIRRVYLPGSVLVDIALASTGHHRLREVASPLIDQLAHSISWTVHLSVLEGSDIRFIAGCESPEPVRVTARVGSRSPAHSTSTGKVLLAQLPRAQLHSLYPNGPAPVTEHTISTMTELEAELDRVLAADYATNVRENEIGLHAVAVPIRTRNAGVIAAITAARPASEDLNTLLPQTLFALRETAAAIAEQLTPDPEPPHPNRHNAGRAARTRSGQ